MIKMQIKRMVIGSFRVVCIVAWIKAILKDKPAWQALEIDRRKKERAREGDTRVSLARPFQAPATQAIKVWRAIPDLMKVFLTILISL